VEVVQGDVLDPDSLHEPMRDVNVLYYLIHSLGEGSGFEQLDVQAAQNCSAAAKAAGVERLIYVGGLGDARTQLSPHLRSRHRTGDALRESGVPVTEFRAAVIVGSGSLSFEMVRYLTERLPIMICPKWVFTRVQPIAIRNVLDYLVAAIESPDSAGRILEIGGQDVLTYAEMMTHYARVRGLRRVLIPVPVLTPRLSSYWVHLITPVPANIAQPLIKGLMNEVIVHDDAARRLFPNIALLDYETSVRLAFQKIKLRGVETSWTDALASSHRGKAPVALITSEGMIIERRKRTVPAPANAVYRAFARLGGQRGWLYMDWSWQIRGIVDRLVGGVGMRRGRRDSEDVRVGDALDFWRVEAVDPGKMMRLRAEMKVPGRAWLEFQAEDQAGSGALFTQSAFFEPRGLLGLLYWFILYPIHSLIFSGLIRALAHQATALAKEAASDHDRPSGPRATA
jgi:uncharacterized protein YbjT (DUF2867 family)